MAMKIDVIDSKGSAEPGWIECRFERDFELKPEALQRYVYASKEPIVYDALLLAAAVEFADRENNRPSDGRCRQFHLRIPVHEPNRWNAQSVLTPLIEALCCVTGDRWQFDFIKRKRSIDLYDQLSLLPPNKFDAVMPYSIGMDSRAVAGIESAKHRSVLKVRVGSEAWDKKDCKEYREHFACVPFTVHRKGRSGEASARSRGFKFALVAGIAAYLSKTHEIIVPESGQGILGPVLVSPLHLGRDYRCHPRFTRWMEEFLYALLSHQVQFTFPQLWHTKGETLSKYVKLSSLRSDWKSSKSCWRNSRYSFVDGKQMQCGVCAACLLRRVSVFCATGKLEDVGTYLCDDLNALSLRGATHPSHVAHRLYASRFEAAHLRDAKGGMRFWENLAQLADRPNDPTLMREAWILAEALDKPVDEVKVQIDSLLKRHQVEWRNFLNSLNSRSFLRAWLGEDKCRMAA